MNVTSSIARLTLITALLAACGGPASPRSPFPDRTEPADTATTARTDRPAFPGFDTRVFPGESVMRQWRLSPYEWVGYYLPAPCHTGSSWLGKRELLAGQGWGVAIVFVGEQQWSVDAKASGADVAVPPPAAPAAEPRCTRANLTAARGERDGATADSLTAAEGFAAGAVVFLDVERVDSVGTALLTYVRAWTRGLMARGRYDPGLYAHAQNARRLYDAMREEMAAARASSSVAGGRGTSPRLWVAGGPGFHIDAVPSRSGNLEANVWQGVLDTNESWGGATLRIDVNVADTRSPSEPRR